MPRRRTGQPFRRLNRKGNTSYGPRQGPKTVDASTLRNSEATSSNEKFEAIRLANAIDEAYGFARYESGKKKAGWLFNMHSTTLEDDNHPGGRAAVDFYFIGDDNEEYFKATLCYDPYFLLATKRGKEAEVEEWCKRAFEGLVKGISKIEKEDLSMPNHLLGYRRTFMKLSFLTVSDLLVVRKSLLPIAEKNKKNMDAMETYAEVANANAGFDIFDDDHTHEKRSNVFVNASDFIVDIREYDVPYHVRVAIDLDIRIGKWYWVEAKHGSTSLSCIEDRLTRADPVVMAYDIETCKAPLKFPDSTVDQIMMISYMIDGQGFLITNREIVSEDIADFEYTPKPEYEGPFMIFNEPDERAVIETFFKHIKTAKPTVMVTYNGDFFDWPFVEARASILGIDMYQEIGFRKSSEDVYQADHCCHLDAFAWVNRDSYLPQGSRGLKAVTVAKLGYDPDELDPELMTPYASEKPEILAEYSVSDAVATYYLYMKYVHPFIFSLCTIIPLGPDDVLRKGTGTLCEMLLMVQAYQKRIVLPNKHVAPKEAFWDGHLLESETYVGGHVESIEAGVFRSDIPVSFALDSAALQQLIDELDAALTFSITVEERKSLDDITNYNEVREQIAQKLRHLRDVPKRSERPSIYHLDVASMYPNIMTTNRLQPDSMVTEADCAACDFNRPGKTCDRRLPWAWRGEYLPAKRDEYNMIRNALENERFPGKKAGTTRSFHELSLDEQASIIKKRLQDYSKKIYHKIHESTTLQRESIICQRENPFYVDTVSTFRDRRYDFKGKQKLWKDKMETLKSSAAGAAEIDEAKKMIVLFDSLQLAHKVILNSFYGYVMRKGSRWYSLEMAGITCFTGASIIQMACQLVERIGRPLELDTDGIWCILPATFPEGFAFKTKRGRKIVISYPCVMLNHRVHDKFTNHQYQDLKDPTTFRYETRSDNSIFFEVDGPYKAMVLPTSKEEDKNLKKRYAVFNHDGSLAELKGFEVKRRGELKLIKIFQTQIFKFFLEGSTLDETYAAVAKVANRWLDVLYSRGTTLADEELIDLICENKSMAKTIEEYGGAKTTAITTARRLAEFLGEQMIKDKGLNCKYIISAAPRNAPVTDRAIPVAIFSAEEHVKRYFLRKWLKSDPGDCDPRAIIDWTYYLERLGSVIQKLITIPAALQKIRNPVPRVAHPDWLERRIRTKDDTFKQKKMTDMFEKKKGTIANVNVNTITETAMELEDFGRAAQRDGAKRGTVTKIAYKRSAPEPAASTDPYASLPLKMPSITKDYPAWLAYQKEKWKIQREQRKRRRQLFSETRTDASDGLGTYFRNQAELIYTSTWQILQLREGDLPGEVQAFVLIGKGVHVIKLIVPRQLYLNLRSDDLPNVSIKGCNVEKVVNHSLPNGHPSVHLFKLSLPEETYVNESKTLNLLFNHPSVEGVYETQVPLSIRAMLKLGNLCTFDETQRGALGRGLEQGFDLSGLRRVPAQEAYLGNTQLGYLYLHHIIAGDRQVFALFSSSKEQAHVVVLRRSSDAQGLPNLSKIYQDGLTARSKAKDGNPWPEPFQYQSALRFKTVQLSTKSKAHLEVASAIKKMRNDESNPLILVVRAENQKLLAHNIPVLKDMPILPLHLDDSDKHLPPLGWQSLVAERLVEHYLELGAWIAHLRELARYGDVPICNLETDDPRFLIDVDYARHLQSERVVLWWSAGPKPDHAGYEKDDVFGPLEAVQMPCINNPGTYSSVCIDLEIRNLAISTVLSSAIVNEAEGSDAVSFNPAAPMEGQPGGGSNVIYSDNAFASASVLALREMVKRWWAEAEKGCYMADLLVQHLVRWVECPGSYLFDRALHYYVRMMSCKALKQLMSDFRRAGSYVVFASANRLLLQTTKADVGNAYALSQYILTTVRSKPLFQSLDLRIKEYWGYLAWYDEFNYGGLGCEQVANEGESQTLDPIMHWHFATFLPLRLQSDFQTWVLEFIKLMHGLKQAQKHHQASTSKEDSVEGQMESTPRLTQLQFQPLTQEPPDTPTSVLADAFSKRLTKHIAAMLRRQHQEQQHAELASDWHFPSLPGTIDPDVAPKLTDPTLQLVKSIMQVLSLDKTIGLEVRLLRKKLLQLFGVGEFSADAAFVNPAASLWMRGLVCDDCTAVHDIDLCRDSAAVGRTAAGDIMRPLRIACPTCSVPYDTVRLEARLIADVQALALSWVAQDVKCAKCGRLQCEMACFTEHCSCSGKWVFSLRKEDLVHRLNVYKGVAQSFGFRLLEHCVVDALDGV